MKTLNELYKEPCSCKLCPKCYGTTLVDSQVDGDLALIACTTCGESGYVSTCRRCQELNTLLAEQETLAMAA